jgi:16S rRNA G966 N2-methylase RsmD
MTDTATYTGQVHPAANVFPMIEGEQFDALVESVRQHGLMEPVWLTPDGTLLDGRNRMAACKAAGIEPTYRVYQGDDLVDFIVRLNIHRRHLSAGQKALAAVDLLPIYEAETKRGRPTNHQIIPADLQELPKHQRESTAKAANAVGSTGRAVGQAKRVTQQAPDLAEQVRAGTLALDAAERQLKRRKVQASEQEARAITMVDVPADAQGKNWKLFAGDFRDRLNDLPDGSIDLIVTDPPYPAEFLPLWADLSKHAARVLKPQGLLVAMVGKIQLPQVMDRLGEHLTYKWVYCQPNPGSSLRILATHVLEKWKPWLCYGNSTFPVGDVDWHEDLVTNSDRSKDKFRWQQSEGPAEYIIEVLSLPGATILDPFAGSGTYGAAALNRGRHFIGCEADAARFNMCAERLGQT